MKKQIIALTGAIALSTAAFAGTASAKTITIQPGDTLSKLAAEHNTTVRTLQNMNNIKSANLIYAGAQLEVGDGNGNATYQAPVKQQTTQSTYKAPAQQQTQAKSTYKAPVQQKQQAQTKSYQSTQKSSNVSSYQGSSSSAKSWIAQKESSNSYEARSATGKYIGKYQLDKSYLNGDYSAANQERVADNYVKQRYGSWEKAKQFWVSNGWY
ncbi:aggregation-promoting factor [Kurthia gibsonii]|uniref:aggregation-promoting factor n=1 Tax=Kurthia gibsonii TaxID=33946 RepID=UPI002DB9031D|nr:LysM peptidoglycan-binding domain-containing protein [Kurthia gibsonii]MEB7771143.1 LysM peptidoglycan-binding domain-containing protein [Kurthia gibsonii]